MTTPATPPPQACSNLTLAASVAGSNGSPGVLGFTVSGAVSTFGPPGEAAGTTASGVSDSQAGISLHIPGTSFGDPPNRALLGHWFRVTTQGHTAVLQDIDLGPADYLNRQIDITGAAVAQLGIPYGSFQTGAQGSAVEVAGPGPSSAVPASFTSPCSNATFVVLSNSGVVFPFPKGAPGVAPTSAWTLDQGVDISAPGGTPELAIASGTIVSEGISGFGPNAPILKLDTPIQVGSTTVAYAYYGHAGPDLVPVGAHVAAGQQISIVGYGIVGLSTGPHIEFGVMPTQALPGNGQTSPAALTLLKTACGQSCP